VVLSATIAPIASHAPDHAKKFAHVAVKELVVVIDHTLQILYTLPYCLHGLETFVDRCIEIRDGVTASCTTHRMQSERVVIASVSTVIAAVFATTVVVVAAAVGAFGSLLVDGENPST
jgi:hypothetical protein